MPLCECGCGKEAKPGNRFIHGHFHPGMAKKTHETVLSIQQTPTTKEEYQPNLSQGMDVDDTRKPIIHQQQPQQTPPPTRRDREIELMRLELQQIDKYMGDRHQNTQITEDERLLLAILRKDVALHPWSVSKRVCQDLGISFDDKEFEIDILRDFIDDYLDFGLPMKRLGRSEVKDIFRAYFDGKNAQEEKPKEKLIT